MKSGGGLIGGGAGAHEGNLKMQPYGKVAKVIGVLSLKGLANGETLVGVVGRGEVNLVLYFQGVGRVVLIEIFRSLKYYND